jgi:hydroxymethylpyrimidine kinase/phosphomethylpyrimidine kinase
MVRILLSIAGFDPSGGAGALMDVAVFEAAGFRGMAVLTALTVQNTREVRRIVPLPPGTVMDQYRALAEDVSFRGVKIGMLGSRKNLGAIGRILAGLKGIPVVVDPVFRSSSGADLLPAASVGSFLKTVRGRASLLTPNLDEASLLSGLPVRTPEEMLRAARLIFDRAEVPCLVKGGHLPKTVINVLYDGRKTVVYRSPRVPKDAHGTGCFLSSSILAALAGGSSLVTACADATDLTHKAIRKAVRQAHGRYLLKPE